jgi:hypothetical protein
MIMSPEGLGNMNDCAGEAQQKFFQPKDRNFTATNDRKSDE